MKLNLTPFHFEELQKQGYSLDVVFMLKMVYEQVDLKTFCEENPKIDALHQSLIRKALITEENKVTKIGEELLLFLESKISRRIVKNKGDEDNTDFRKWWETFPGTNTFDYKGKHFEGERSLRINESACRIKFDKIINEKEYTVDDLIESLKYDVFQKKEASFRKGENKLTFMQNSLTYLNQYSFAPFVELIRGGAKIVETPKPVGGTDI